MKTARFDSLTRHLAARLTRRAGLGAALGLAAGGVLAGTASAATCRTGHQTCSRNAQCCSGDCPVGRVVPIHLRNRCACDAGWNLCRNRCVDFSSDDRNCGACGVRCSDGGTCVSGACVVPASCDDTGAFICAVTIEGEVIEIDSLCIDLIYGGPADCASSAACQAYADTLDLSEVTATYGDIEAICLDSVHVAGNPTMITRMCAYHILDHNACQPND